MNNKIYTKEQANKKIIEVDNIQYYSSFYLLKEINKYANRNIRHSNLKRTLDRELKLNSSFQMITQTYRLVTKTGKLSSNQPFYLLNEQFYNHILYLEKHKGHHKKSNLLYVITDGELNKIGITHNNINQRLKALQTGNGRQLKVIYTLKTDKAEELEYELHNKFNKYRKVGEWFSIDVITILEEIERLK